MRIRPCPICRTRTVHLRDRHRWVCANSPDHPALRRLRQQRRHHRGHLRRLRHQVEDFLRYSDALRGLHEEKQKP